MAQIGKQNNQKNSAGPLINTEKGKTISMFFHFKLGFKTMGGGVKFFLFCVVILIYCFCLLVGLLACWLDYLFVCLFVCLFACFFFFPVCLLSIKWSKTKPTANQNKGKYHKKLMRTQTKYT